MFDPVSSSLDGLRVLVVEDDDDERELIAGLLEGAGCLVVTANSVKDALARLSDCNPRPHAIVSDIGMPDEDGYSLMRAVRARSRADGGDTPSVALTAYAGPEDRANALEAGFTLYLSKPVSLAKLLAAMRRVRCSGPTPA